MSKGTNHTTGLNDRQSSLIVGLSLFLGLFLAVTCTSLLVMNAGESPSKVFSVLFLSSFGSVQNFSSTLFYSTPLFLTGVAVLLPLKAGLFNIGGEGQLHMGALGAISYAALVSLVLNPHIDYGVYICIPLLLGAFLCAAFFGGAWGALAGYLRAKRKVHEVIVTIMMNFIAIAITNWFILNPYKNSETQAAETFWIHPSLRLSKIWNETPASFPMALFIAVLAVLALRNTWWGYRARATGANPNAAHIAGIKVEYNMVLAMALGGAAAGVVGFHEVYAHAHRLVDGFSTQFGFTGIAVALLCRGRVRGLILAALIMGALHKGALELDLETDNITRDLAAIIQAFVLVSLAITPALELLLRKLFIKHKRLA